MTETKRTLERAGRRAPTPDFTIEDVRVRRERHARRRRLSGGIVGVGVTLALVAAALSVGSLGDPDRAIPLDGGIGLPPATRGAVVVGPNQYSYVHIQLVGECTIGESSPDTSCGDPHLDFESWWKTDNSGRIDVSRHQNYGIDAGTFGPGAFHTEGDLADFPLDPEALKKFLLDRSSADGASPRPDVTPAPGVPLDEGLLWNAIRDYLGSTQYLNATPQLRASMLEVLATIPMVRVDATATDPAGRQAIALRFFAYDADVVVYVDPGSHDFLGMTTDYATGDGSSKQTLIVESAGATSSLGAQPEGADRSVAAP